MNMKGLLGGRGDDAPQTSGDVDDAAAEADAATPADVAPVAAASKVGARAWPVNRLRRFTDALKAPNEIAGGAGAGGSALQTVQAINAEAASYATTQIAVGPNMLITQAGGMVAQAAANYFEASTSLAIAGKSVLMKDLAQKTIDENVSGMAMDAMGLLLTDLFVATAALVAGAAEAIEGEAASVALDKIDESLQKYQALLDKKGA
ncbi:hypothetical protein CH72_319 [Burkholderia ambifaria AMMD]|uniref:Uncharacterized protein n=1 Tax=Burkholderia ambifaria (strain ATCC BAA-244 / DSM 16087 / CCUG 44356 / LMG 19182 / AMMD) TaxID=339670 RepID=Q0BGE8_BURCM|nr:hypothetical protein [Burkholderia ambifaria]ABI86775.1 conserved hypothetical protein [Burkholderia ambifaria AMMD]AJY22545.1 hypothetical protein CH72_319 [Burkholderia ambifaria AMMD]MBR7929603.1 hypothetical protein [Burkholderia ambifaria]PEH65956.1 hypothetical protein CRM91_27045 [Burkholderia ambifaria]QQC02906.1 hypothetical protein I6H84_08835 [Burkholderia ambifaria]